MYETSRRLRLHFAYFSTSPPTELSLLLHLASYSISPPTPLRHRLHFASYSISPPTPFRLLFHFASYSTSPSAPFRLLFHFAPYFTSLPTSLRLLLHFASLSKQLLFTKKAGRSTTCHLSIRQRVRHMRFLHVKVKDTLGLRHFFGNKMNENVSPFHWCLLTRQQLP